MSSEMFVMRKPSSMIGETDVDRRLLFTSWSSCAVPSMCPEGPASTSSIGVFPDWSFRLRANSVLRKEYPLALAELGEVGLVILRAEAPGGALLTSLDLMGIVVVSSEKRTLGVSLSCAMGLSTAAEDEAAEVADLPVDGEGPASPSASSAMAMSMLRST